MDARGIRDPHEAALEALWARAAPSIPEWLPMRYIDWLPTLYEVALGTFRAPVAGASNLYLVLARLCGPSAGALWTLRRHEPLQPRPRASISTRPGIRAAGSVLKRGLEVLTGPTLHLQGVARAEAARIEAQLAQALEDAGLLVEGGH